MRSVMAERISRLLRRWPYFILQFLLWLFFLLRDHFATELLLFLGNSYLGTLSAKIFSAFPASITGWSLFALATTIIGILLYDFFDMRRSRHITIQDATVPRITASSGIRKEVGPATGPEDQPIGQNLPSLFICFSHEDDDFANRLYDDLQTNGVKCWFAPADMRIGDRIRPTVDREIRIQNKQLVILSKDSIQSEWVGDEVEAALEEEIVSKRTLLFPIRLDDAVLNNREDWAAKIKRRRHIGDFSNWEEAASYQLSLARLLRDLKIAG